MRRILAVLLVALACGACGSSRSSAAADEVPVVVDANGDMVPASAATNDDKVAALVVADHPNFFMALGDEQYDSGRLIDFNKFYDHSYGPLKAVTLPVPGNHEWKSGSRSGYNSYFGRTALSYKADLGNGWMFIGVDSMCTKVACGVGSAQYNFVKNTLAVSGPCTIIAWHEPFRTHGDHSGNPRMGPIFNLAKAAGVPLNLVGHNHWYEREALDGSVRQVVVGTGGAPIDGTAPKAAYDEVLLREFGYLRLSLLPGSYSAEFVNASGVVDDRFGGSC